jgi:hypothetical protein
MSDRYLAGRFSVLRSFMRAVISPLRRVMGADY